MAGGQIPGGQAADAGEGARGYRRRLSERTTLRTRIAAAAGLSVALTVLAAAIGVYLAVRSDLRGEVDRGLQGRAHALARAASSRPGFPGPGGATGAVGTTGADAGATGQTGGGTTGPTGGADAAGGAVTTGGGTGGTLANPPGGFVFVGPDNDAGRPDAGGFPGRVEPAPFGGATGYVQFVAPEGTVTVPAGQGSTSTRIPLSASDRAIASSGAGLQLSDRTVQGTRLRVLTLGAGSETGAVMVARPLTEVQRELSHLLLILGAVGLAGIVIAVALGAVVARTALAPVVRFTRRTESVSGALHVSERLPVQGRDELTRLAESFNATLDALERSVGAQRQLVADASHELRTPLASLRANIQLLDEADRLPADEQAAIHRDIIAELDELTAIVGDVAELARGTEPQPEPEDVRLDELVREAAAAAERRGDVRVQLALEPTLVSGRAERVARAVSNVIDNARKYSPPGAAIDVALRRGVLSVRDHGPGFKDEDLPFVFDRFYRAREARSMPGSGLGLAIVRQAAEAGGGSATAANAPGGGALLTVSFGPARIAPPEERGANDSDQTNVRLALRQD